MSLKTESVLYAPSPDVEFILRGHNTPHSILAEGETPQDMLERVAKTLTDIEVYFGTPPNEIAELCRTFKEQFVAGNFTVGIPTLTNAGRVGHESSALSSCVVIPVDLRQESAKETIVAYYKQNMGSGFNFTKYKDPVAMLRWLNTLSAEESATHHYERRIANMGTLHVGHPEIRKFIQAKVEDKSLIHFNISVEVDDKFMGAAIAGGMYRLSDSSMINAEELLHDISRAAWSCGDPGLINLERMNVHNPIASIAAYECSPPCGEMGLAPGETCQFGYINLPHYVNKDGSIKLKELGDLVKLAVRILDNAVQYGIERQPSPEGKYMTQLKRKIGISVSGLADVFLKIGVPYDSEEAKTIARDLLSYINYQAKLASVELASTRGSCDAMNFRLNNAYYDHYIANRYADQKTNTVTRDQWLALDEQVVRDGKFRNIHQTALPPGGRASFVLRTNHSIEPIFGPSHLSFETVHQILDVLASSLLDESTDIQNLFNTAIEQGSFQNLPISDHAKRLLRTAIEIKPEDHVLMAAALSGMYGVTDESASKTVNLSSFATPQDIYNIYILAHQVGLKNISVYRDMSLSSQPRKLS